MSFTAEFQQLIGKVNRLQSIRDEGSKEGNKRRKRGKMKKRIKREKVEVPSERTSGRKTGKWPGRYKEIVLQSRQTYIDAKHFQLKLKQLDILSTYSFQTHFLATSPLIRRFRW